MRDFRVLMPLIVSLSIPYEKTRLPSGPDQFGRIFVTPEANPGRSSGVRPVTPEAIGNKYNHNSVGPWLGTAFALLRWAI